MKWLFIFAHPDDESVACAGTMHLLTEAGHQVKVVSVTDGAAGEVNQRAQTALSQAGSIGALRRHELTAALGVLGVSDFEILKFKDGGITNQQVWNELTLSLIEVIEEYQPDAVVTFDHSGWYFHLDHVGVSIATTIAVPKVSHPPDLFFHVHFYVKSDRWQYVFNTHPPLTHRVPINEVIDLKIQAFDCHASQNLDTPRRHLQQAGRQYETYQLVSASRKGQQLLKELPFFVPYPQRKTISV